MSGSWMNWLDQAVIALLNGVFHGLLLTVFVWCMLAVFKKINASTKYLIWMGTLVCLGAFPVIHFLLATAGTGQDVQALKQDRSVPAQSTLLSTNGVSTGQLQSFVSGKSTENPVDFEVFEPTSEADLNVFFEPSFDSHDDMAEGLIHPDEWGHEVEADLTQTAIPSHSFSSNQAPLIPHQEEIKPPTENWVASNLTDSSESPITYTSSVVRFLQWIQNWTIPARLPTWVVVSIFWVFVFGMLWNLARLGYDLWLLQCVKKQAIAPPADLTQMFQIMTPSMKGRSEISLRIHRNVKTPMALGFFKPMILMPEVLLNSLEDSAKKQILKHELAHLLRYDDWTNLLQHLIQAFYFFHPAVWLIGRRVDVEREIACDDFVLDGAGKAKAYALMLTQFANRERDRHLAAASAVWNKQSQIKERIEMLLDHHRNTAPRPARLSTGLLTLAALLVAAITLHYGPRVALADEPAADSSDMPTTPATNSNSIFENVVEEPRVKNRDEVGFNTAMTSDDGSLPGNNARGAAASVEVEVEANSDNPYQIAGDVSKPAYTGESQFSLPEPVAPKPQKPQRIRSRQRSSRYGRSPEIRHVPGTAIVEFSGETHAHPVEMQIVSQHEIKNAHSDFDGAVAAQPSSSLENRIIKLEKLVQKLLKNSGKQHPESYMVSRSSTAAKRGLALPEVHKSGPGLNEPESDLYGHTTGALDVESQPAVPSFDGLEELSHEVIQRARELEQKRRSAALASMEIEQKRSQLRAQMLRLSQEMAELEMEMKVLEEHSKNRKKRQSFSNDAFGEFLPGDAFDDAFDSDFGSQ